MPEPGMGSSGFGGSRDAGYDDPRQHGTGGADFSLSRGILGNVAAGVAHLFEPNWNGTYGYAPPGGYRGVGGNQGGPGGAGGISQAQLMQLMQQFMQSGGFKPTEGGLPFQFGAPPSQVTPNFMPQITPPGGMPPPGQGPQNMNDLYGMYGVGANAPMPQAPTLPPPPPPPPASEAPPQQGPRRGGWRFPRRGGDGYTPPGRFPGGFGTLPFSQVIGRI